MLRRHLHRLRTILATCPEDARPHLTPAPSPDALAKLRSVAGGSLPGAFEEFLSLHDAFVAMELFNGIWLGGTVGLARSIERRDFPTVIIVEGRECTVIPIATDGGGVAFLHELPDGRAWRYQPLDRSTECVASSFEDFFEHVVDDCEHHLADDQDWRYLSR